MRFGKLTPVGAKEKYYEMYGEIAECAIYGCDDYTEELIEYLWTKPEMHITLTDPAQYKLDYYNKLIGDRSFSMHRWEAVNHVGFIESGYWPVIVVAKHYLEQVKGLPNPYNVKLVVLEEIDLPPPPKERTQAKRGPKPKSKVTKETKDEQ